MPGIKELEQFRNELRKIANEPEVSIGWGEKYEELPLPKEAPVPDVNVDDLLGNIDLDNIKNTDKNTSEEKSDIEELKTEDSAPPVTQQSDNLLPDLDNLDSGMQGDLDDFNLDNFLNADDLSSPENISPAQNTTAHNDIQDISGDTVSENAPFTATKLQSLKDEHKGEEISLFVEERDEEPEETAPKEFNSLLSDLDMENAANRTSEEEIDADSPDVPEALLSGFGEMVENARKSDDKDTDESVFPDFTLDAQNTPEIKTVEPVDDIETLEPVDFDMPDISAKDEADFDIPDLEEVEELQEPEASNEIDISIPSEDASSDDMNLSNSSAPEDLDAEGSNSGTLPNSDFSEFNLSPNNENTEEPHSEGSVAPPDFSNVDIPDLDEHTAFAIDDNVLDTDMGTGMDEFSVPESFIQFSPDKGFKFSDSKKSGDTEDYDGKIPLSISEADYDILIDRISSFPLNVRLEIENYLANGDDTELNKMEIVHLIVSGASLKKIAAKLETILEKPIQIPKGFDKQSYEEYERQKKTFKYRFMHKILPAATLFAMAAILVFSILVLIWHFIYKPITAESIYKAGFAGIENGQYENALKSFDEAGTYKKKRKWYFKYANAFRLKKQFLSAEAIYKRLLFDFNHDVQGGIEYADMLSTDLRNYEKAEKVLRRGVLDFHINDKKALLALGDIYLDWADEDAEKYENAKKTFVSLINMYGEDDVVLGRMMRYFIRTDNLAEVLPLKEHFMNSKFNKDELVELSGYLLEKRYEPKPSDSDKLRSKIEDLRELLEKAVKTVPESPEAHYNFARFFIHNYKPKAAKTYLETAIKLYQDSIKMTPRRLIRELDSMRLYGELLTDEKRYNEAQEIYAKALSKYEDYSIQKRIYPSSIIGKLYADYGDISYFISGDYDSALNSYRHAVQELYDTPSIQYRMGYIHYQNENYIDAMKAMTLAYTEKPNDKNLLYGFGNVLFKRGNYFASQAYYERLMELLEAEKIRKGIVFPQARIDHAEFVENYMHTANNLGVVLNRIAVQSGDSAKNGRAISLLGESTRAWDNLSRNPETMIRSKTVNLAYANIQNIIKPRSVFIPEIYTDIPKTLENEKILQQLEDR